MPPLGPPLAICGGEELDRYHLGYTTRGIGGDREPIRVVRGPSLSFTPSAPAEYLTVSTTEDRSPHSASVRADLDSLPVPTQYSSQECAGFVGGQPLNYYDAPSVRGVQDYAEELGNTGRPRRSTWPERGMPLYTIHAGSSAATLSKVLAILDDRCITEGVARSWSSVTEQVRGETRTSRMVTICSGGTYHVDYVTHAPDLYDDEQWIRDVLKVFPNAM